MKDSHSPSGCRSAGLPAPAPRWSQPAIFARQTPAPYWLPTGCFSSSCVSTCSGGVITKLCPAARGGRAEKSMSANASAGLQKSERCREFRRHHVPPGARRDPARRHCNDAQLTESHGFHGTRRSADILWPRGPRQNQGKKPISIGPLHNAILTGC